MLGALGSFACIKPSILVEIFEEIDEGLSPLEKVVEPPFDLVVDGATKSEMLLCLDLLKMAQQIDPIRMVGLVVCLYPKSVRVHYELLEGNVGSV